MRVVAHGAGMPDATCSDLSSRLDAEWAALRRRPAALARARRWGVTVRPVADLDDLLAAVGHRVSTDPADNDRLRVLLQVARTDDLAARVVLQRILPGLLARVRRRGRARRDGVFEELLGAAWISIRTTRHGEGCANLAAALVYDAVHRAFTAPARRRSAGEVALDPASFEEDEESRSPSSLEELLELVADARRHGLSDEDLRLVADLLRTGSAAVVAAERDVTPRTIRNHRARAAHEIRRIACADRAA